MVSASTKWSGRLRFEAFIDSGHRVLLDGERSTASTPTEVLIVLCGCTASDVVRIMRKTGEPLKSLEVLAEAEKAPSPPCVYTAIHLTYHVGGPVASQVVEDAVRLSQERYCSVSAILKKTTKITHRIELDSN